MRRHLWILTLAGLFNASLLASDASACCHKQKCATYTCAPACQPAPPPPPPPPPPVCEPAPCRPKKCGLFGGHKLFGCCHKPKCAPPPTPVCEVAPAPPAPIPCGYAAPVASYQAPLPSYQAAPSIQAAPPAVPAKQGY